jgi:dUTP pyrophosphatase
MFTIMIKVKKIHPLATIPKRANETDAGADLYSIENIDIPPLSRALIHTGISLEIPSQSIYGRIAPRSGLALKRGIDVLAGVVDSGYRGEICVLLFNTDKDNTYEIKQGDRIAQIIFEQHLCLPLTEVEDLTDSNRSVNGFGSSGIK